MAKLFENFINQKIVYKSKSLEPKSSSDENSEPFSRDELRFLEKKYISVDLDNCVGRGTFGSLYVALSHQYSYVVIKRYENYSQAFSELEVLRLFGKERVHTNVITFYGSHVFRNHLYLLIQYSNVGDLGRFYEQVFANRSPSETEIFEIFYDIYSGVEHMHSYGWAHRDLKFENIVGFRNELNPFLINFKLTDFGSAVYGLTEEGKCQSFQTYCGSPFTMPPEVTQTFYNAFLYDSYSLGVILYELSHDKQLPHSVASDYCPSNRVEWLIRHNKKKNDLKSVWFKDCVSPELKALILSLIEPNPIKRKVVQQIKASEWWHTRQLEWTSQQLY